MTAPAVLPQEVLMTVLSEIEGIVCDDLAEEWSMLAANRRLRGRAKDMQEKLSLIYRLAHGFNSSHSCYHVHAGWRELIVVPEGLDLQL